MDIDLGKEGDRCGMCLLRCPEHCEIVRGDWKYCGRCEKGLTCVNDNGPDTGKCVRKEGN